MESIDIVIETIKHSSVKYKYDAPLSCFKVKKILPMGMVFPYHFGFIPGTRGEDGDPLDAMVISESSSFTGAHLACRLIGALLASQSERGRTTRNDRYFFIPIDSIVFAHIKTLNDFGSKHNNQLKDFFTNYNLAENKKFTPIKIIAPAQAQALIKKAF
jgi:inorganic pyrophosphatase